MPLDLKALRGALADRTPKRLGHGLRLFYRETVRNQLSLRAGALTYNLALSLVPVLAVGFSVLKGFGFQNSPAIRETLLKAFAENEAVVDGIIGYIDKTQVGALGVVGVISLLITALMMLSGVEDACNAVFRVKRGRSLGRKTADYLSVGLIVPILVVSAAGLTTTVENHQIFKSLQNLPLFTDLWRLGLKLLPYIAVWAAFSFLYAFMPNAPIPLGSAVLAGLAAAAVWQTAQVVYVRFQVGAAGYNAIYGSFAQVPLFLVWIYTAWLIILGGMALCRVLIVRRELGRVELAAPSLKAGAALAVLDLLDETFARSEPPLSVERLADRLEVMSEDLLLVLETLDAAGLARPLAAGGFDPSGPPTPDRERRVLVAFGLAASDDGKTSPPAALREQFSRRGGCFNVE